MVQQLLPFFTEGGKNEVLSAWDLTGQHIWSKRWCEICEASKMYLNRLTQAGDDKILSLSLQEELNTFAVILTNGRRHTRS